MLSYLNDIDTQIFLTLNGVCSPFWDSFMSEFSGKWIWIPFYASILFVISRKFNYKQTLGILVCAALCIALSDQTCATLIRPFAERMRPANLANPISPYVHIVDGYRGGLYGFPSCHAANSFALAMFIAVLLADRKLTAVIFAWAAVNSYSRLYLGVHYPSDLIAGAAIGIAFGWGMALLAGRVARKFRTAHPDSPARLSGIPSAVCILTVIGITLHAVLSLLRQP